MFEDIPRPGLWKRLLLGAFLVVFAAAGATAVAAPAGTASNSYGSSVGFSSTAFTIDAASSRSWRMMLSICS